MNQIDQYATSSTRAPTSITTIVRRMRVNLVADAPTGDGAGAAVEVTASQLSDKAPASSWRPCRGRSRRLEHPGRRRRTARAQRQPEADGDVVGQVGEGEPGQHDRYVGELGRD